MPRNWQVPLTPEAEEILKRGFQGVSSYVPAAVATKDMEEFFNAIEYLYNPLQLQIYTRYCDTYLDGLIPEDFILKIYGALFDTAKLMGVLCSTTDKDEDGLISKDDFNEVMLVLYVYDPKVAFIDYQTFLKDADDNNEGKVRVEDVVEWISNHLHLHTSTPQLPID